MAELLAIASIIGYGLFSSQQGRETRPDRNSYADALGSGQGLDEEYDVKPTNMVRKYRKKAEKRWKKAQVPKESGIITPNMRPSEVMPYFTSGKTMNTNENYKQRKMELFTGGLLDGHSVSGTYKHKVEAANMFGMTPQGRVTSDGTVGNAPGDTEMLKARSVNSHQYNNVLPAEQLRVGPGLGVGPEVAATGGFHQFYRQLPLNINEYKLTQLPGRLVPGGTTMGGKGEIQQVASVNHNPDALVLNYDDRPPEATPNGAILASTQYGRQPRGYAGLRPYEKNYEGIAEADVNALQARYIDQTRGRPRTGDGDTEPIINPNGERDGTGSYVTENMCSMTLESQRGLVNRYITPPGATGVAQPGGEMRPEFVPETTIRESYEDVYYTGPAGTTVTPTEPMNVFELQPESRHAKRAGQDRAYTPGAGRVNNFAPAAQGAYGLKEHPTYNALQHVVSEPIEQTFLPASQGDDDRFGTKSNVNNPWGNPASLQIANNQLADNKFNRDVTNTINLDYDAGQPMKQQNFKPTAWVPNNADDMKMLPLWKRQTLQKAQKAQNAQRR